MSTFILVVAALILVGSSTASIIAPTPVTVVEAAANLSMIKTLSCHDAGCKDCVPVPVVPTGATATDNCVTVGESSTSYWIFSNGTLLMKFYATIDCDGQETVGERYVEEEKCYNNGPHSSSVFFYVPPGPAPTMPKPALIKDLKIYDCLGHKCQKDCKLQKFVNATIRANCIMWPEISTSYWVLGKGKMMMNVYTGKTCTGTPIETDTFSTDVCKIINTGSEIIYYNSTAIATTTNDGGEEKYSAAQKQLN